ncbi:hypothetical protein COCSUDRAFT_57289 [Coccomyxa subellipsoidea C-169]|uniref:YLP motif-containing protein 1 n=1 Tax=Coccomyxa subellipsoidea (strain C-169) TaxID=574566 RepID=I0YQQ6_COCSC|nr:hypothetical protein COCSUDRAFT_57289 [Coccomyxa subellipsoidea C-169]EIE20725.1 hypothetical protein COCSUDRAFT_57289 [Coccomyxa subellipsoidea C-169]|eukprot:XP_005645269.1 hypothetical protein COCSUDRAFT_57289 [Coccomyxa subellipsoidea C-169]
MFHQQPGVAQGPGVGASQPPLPADHSYHPPLPGEHADPPPLPSNKWSSAPLLSSEAAPPLPEEPPSHGSGQGYPPAGHPWAPSPAGGTGQYASTPQQHLAGPQGPYPASYQTGTPSPHLNGHGQPPWSQAGSHDPSYNGAPWATPTAQPAAYSQQQQYDYQLQQYPIQAAYGHTPSPYGHTPSPYGHQQPPQGGPPNPYAQMYGQQQAWRGPHGHQQPAVPQHLASGHGISHQAGHHTQAAQQYQQLPGQQQPGAWAAHTPPAQQPSWAQSPQPSPAAANGYPQQQPPLPSTPAEAVPAHAEVPGRPVLPLNVTVVDDLLTGPGRAKRPKLIAVVIRGLPGSGKSLIARRLRDAEVAAGGSAPRIHCIDDYFVTEVEKEVWEKDASGKRKMKLVQETEYCYEADMEGVYKASLLKAFTRTAEEGRSPFVIVDAPNLRVDDFKPYWDAGQRAGYEVYVLQAPETDPKVCFARNTHSRTLEDVTAAQQQWDPAGIKEVDMEDESGDERSEHDADSPAASRANKGRWASLDNGAEAQPERPRKMRKTRFTERTESPAARDKQARRLLLLPACGAWKAKKRVRWADEAEEEDTGFHIGGASLRQLETVYVLEGLGPPKEDSYGQKSFSDQVKADHKSEQHNFRDILLGHRRPS